MVSKVLVLIFSLFNANPRQAANRDDAASCCKTKCPLSHAGLVREYHDVHRCGSTHAMRP